MLYVLLSIAGLLLVCMNTRPLKGWFSNLVLFLTFGVIVCIYWVLAGAYNVA
jgi:hypothetical protein